jgi:hypothetical protein
MNHMFVLNRILITEEAAKKAKEQYIKDHYNV